MGKVSMRHDSWSLLLKEVCVCVCMCIHTHYVYTKKVQPGLSAQRHCPACRGSRGLTLQLLPQMVDQQYDQALVFEDDVRFQANFKRRVLRLMEEVQQVELDWDIM